MPKHAQPKPGQRGDPGHQQHAPARLEPEDHRHEHRHAAVDAGPGRDPQRLPRDQLLGVHRRGEDRVVGVLELVLDEGRVHGRERAREQDRRRHDPGPDEVDVVVAGDGADQRPEPEAEGQQVDRGVDRRRERRRAPERREVHDLAHHHPLQRGPLQAPEPALRPAARVPPSGDLLAGQQHEHVLEVGHRGAHLDVGRRRWSAGSPPTCPVRRVRQPRARASASTSASRAGGP